MDEHKLETLLKSKSLDKESLPMRERLENALRASSQSPVCGPVIGEALPKLGPHLGPAETLQNIIRLTVQSDMIIDMIEDGLSIEDKHDVIVEKCSWDPCSWPLVVGFEGEYIWLHHYNRSNGPENILCPFFIFLVGRIRKVHPEWERKLRSSCPSCNEEVSFTNSHHCLGLDQAFKDQLTLIRLLNLAQFTVKMRKPE